MIQKYSQYDSSQIETYSIVNLVVIGVVLLFTSGLTAFNLSSMTVLWMVFGQMRILQFLLLQDGYVSQYVKKFIIGFKFTLFSFSFFNIKDNILYKMTAMKPAFSYLDFSQENNTLSDLGNKLRRTLSDVMFRLYIGKCFHGQH